MKHKLYLYVWREVLPQFSVDSIMFALAENADHARELIIESTENWDNDMVRLELKKDPEVVTLPKGFYLHGGG